MGTIKRVLAARSIAIPVTVIICLAQVLAGGGRSLEKLRRPAEAALSAEMEFRASRADDFVKIAKRNLKDGDASVAALEKAIETLEKAKTAGKKLSAGQNLTFAARAVNDALLAASLNGVDAGYRFAIFSDLEEANTRLRHYYNAEAAEYNAKLAGFPAGVLASIGIAARMPLAE